MLSVSSHTDFFLNSTRSFSDPLNSVFALKEQHQILFVFLHKELVMKLRQSQPLFVDCFAGVLADVGAKGENI